MVVKRGLIVWMSVFATFLAVMSSFAMAVLLINEGAGTIVRPYLLGGIFGGLSTETYMWVCVTATFILLGVTCIIAYSKQPPDPEIVKMFLKVGGNLAALRKAQEASITETADQMEYNRKVNQKFFGNIKTDLEEANKESLALLENQKKTVKKIRLDLVSTIEKKMDETGEKLSADLKKQETAIIGAKRLSEESAVALKKQQADLEEIGLRLERIEGNMVPNQAMLKSLDNPENIKGIGPSLGKELTGLGITSVGDFITTDPEVIGEKTRVSQEMAENLQSMGQLMMVPGVDANDAEILVEAGIKSRKELADQDLIQLSRRVGEISRIYVDQGKISKDERPTIEKVSSWIRMAK
jgi:predicted flap endonuclease-1-like 5' DNA nuclease